MSSVSKKQKGIQEGNPIATVIIYILVILAAVICIYPMWYVFCMSISSPEAVAGEKVFWRPIGIQFNAYKIIAGKSEMWRSYGMTIFYVVTSTACMLLNCVLMAYPLSSPNLIGRKAMTIYIMIPMYFSGGLIPTFMIMKMLGLYNNIWVMILRHAISIWYIILTRTYFASIPETMREAARIDGANSFQTLSKIYLPLSKPILAVIAIYTVVGVWNGWFTANVYLKDKNLQPLQLYLRRVLVTTTTNLAKPSTPEEAIMMEQTRLNNMSLQYAMIIFTTLPVIVTYPFLQKYFVKGVMIGSIKG